MSDTAAQELCAITGISADEAAALLEAAAGDLATAVQVCVRVHAAPAGPEPVAIFFRPEKRHLAILPHAALCLSLLPLLPPVAPSAQLHFDNQDMAAGAARDAAHAGASRDAEYAAALADQEYGGHGDEDADGLDDDYDDYDDDGFPEPVPDEGGAPPPPRVGGGGAARRAQRSPVPGEPGGGGAAGRGGGGAPVYPRLAAAYGWMAANVPFFRYAERLGRLLYRTGLISLVGWVLWAPLALLGLAGPGGALGMGGRGRPPPPPFDEWFEQNHGNVHPRFFRGSCQQALSRSKTDARFLLAYLHDGQAADCATFCDRVLSSALFQHFVDENFVLWVGDTATGEGSAVRRALRVQSCPALVMLAHGDMGGGALPGAGMGGGGPHGEPMVQALGTVQGARVLNEEALIASLQAQLEAFEPVLVAARAEQQERLNDRIMREEQEQEYLRSLAEDEAKDAREAAEREAAERAQEEERARVAAEEQAALDEEAAEEARRAARLAKAAAVPPEPPAGPDATRLVVRLPDGRRLDRRFEKSCALQTVINYVESEAPDEEEFDLVSVHPPMTYTRSMRPQTLVELGLHPGAQLFTREAEDED